MIYLDSAATSLLRPDSVQYAVTNAMLTMASPGRGGHEAAMRAAALCLDCRENLARLFNVSEPDDVVFTFNATHSLNIAIGSLICPGATVLISGYEHNSVTRPLKAIGARVITVETPLFEPDKFVAAFERALYMCDAAIFTHVSNVFGYILPVSRLSRLCRQAGKPFIIDASQSAGCLEIDQQALGADFIAMPGHKGLMGGQGTGVLLCRGSAKPLIYGGSGSESRSPDMPEFLPDRLEAGTHNVPGIAGLNAGVKYILRLTPAEIRRRERRLLDIFAGELHDAGGIRMYYSPDLELQAGVLSIVPESITPEELGGELSEHGVAVRTGLHCAPCAHKTVGTLDTGTVRLSFSPFNTDEEVVSAARLIRKIIKT